MQSNTPESQRSGSQPGADQSVRPWLRNSLLAAGLLSMAAAALFLRKGSPREDSTLNPDSAQSAPEAASKNSFGERARAQRTDAVPAGNEAAIANSSADRATAALTPSAAPTPKPEPSAVTRQLVGSLCQLVTAPGAMTPEQALHWKERLQALVQQGGAAVPAILEFLEKNLDVGFGEGGKAALGYSSARAAMFDALLQIGGSEGVDGMRQVLRNTADPREIALLAQSLEKLAPEQYRQEAITAAVQTLAMASNGKLQGTDVAPLFQVLLNFGGTGAVEDLEQAAKHWNYYAAMGLAQLPDGAGVPALIQMAQGSTSARGNALEMLAQVASQYPVARAALLDLARANKIGPNFWPYLTPLLAGDQYYYQDAPIQGSSPAGTRRAGEGAHVLFGNQHFYTAPDLANLTPEQISQRTALIDELQGVTSDPAAVKALQAARLLLEKRLASVAAARTLPQ